jgi:hypothetical protein
MWAVREELGTLAAKTRERHLGRLSETERALYLDGEETPHHATEMRRDFRRTATEIYCDQLQMSSEILEPLFQEYEDAF